MSKPLLYDVFCGGGGCTKGYQQAGFRVVGIDREPMPRYCGDGFMQMDAFEFFRRYMAGEYEPASAFHCSPPCQGYANVTRWRGNQNVHPRMIAPVRDALTETGRPYVIENVGLSELEAWLMLCGSMFGLRVQRHRYFEAPWLSPVLMPSCRHDALMPFMHKAERAYADAMGCEWMDSKTARQAIPPAYTTWIGAQLLAYLGIDTTP